MILTTSIHGTGIVRKTSIKFLLLYLVTTVTEGHQMILEEKMKIYLYYRIYTRCSSEYNGSPVAINADEIPLRLYNWCK